MNLYHNPRVIFFEDFDNHTYIKDGKEILIGVTSLMKKHKLGHQYDVPDRYSEEEWEAILKHASDVGTMAHRCIEAYCNDEVVVENPLIKSFRKLGLNIVATEYLVSDNDVVASSIDLVEEVEDGVFNLIDMKRTSTLHEDSLYWQLGAYKVLFLMANPGAKVAGCYALHIKKGNKDDIDKDTVQALKKVKVASEKEVLAWFLAEKEGRTYIPAGSELAIPDKLSTMLATQMPRLMALQDEVKSIENLVSEAKNWLYEQMLARGIEEVEVGGCKIKLKKPYDKQALDTKTLKEKHPDLVEKYTKTSEVKGSVLITPIKN